MDVGNQENRVVNITASSVPANRSRKEFGIVYRKKVHVRWAPCDRCREVGRESSLHFIDGGNHPELSVESLLCLHCSHFKKSNSKKFCRLS